MSEGEKSQDSKESSGKPTAAVSLEILFGSALAGAASLLKDSGQRTLATSMAPAVGYIVVKLGRRLVDEWIPKWTTPKIPPPETPESRIRVFIKEAKNELGSGRLAPDDAARKAQHINSLEEALKQKLLDDLLTEPPLKLPPSSEDSNKEGPDQKALDK